MPKEIITYRASESGRYVTDIIKFIENSFGLINHEGSNEYNRVIYIIQNLKTQYDEAVDKDKLTSLHNMIKEKVNLWMSEKWLEILTSGKWFEKIGGHLADRYVWRSSEDIKKLINHPHIVHVYLTFMETFHPIIRDDVYIQDIVQKFGKTALKYKPKDEHNIGKHLKYHIFEDKIYVHDTIDETKHEISLSEKKILREDIPKNGTIINGGHEILKMCNESFSKFEFRDENIEELKQLFIIIKDFTKKSDLIHKSELPLRVGSAAMFAVAFYLTPF